MELTCVSLTPAQTLEPQPSPYDLPINTEALPEQPLSFKQTPLS